MESIFTAFLNIPSNLLLTLFHIYLIAQKKIFYVSGSKQYYKKTGTVHSSTTYNQDAAGLKHEGSLQSY